MAIPFSQLETWSHQGAVTSSTDTYATVRRALENQNASYANRRFEIFLQGSYGNHTNIYAESDVDIVICYTDAFYSDLDLLPGEQKSTYQTAFRDADYNCETFRRDVQSALVSAFGQSVQLRTKAIKIAASGARRNADVIVAFRHRRYWEFTQSNQRFGEGICFLTNDGTRIYNFPRQHSANLTAKHQETGNRYKPAIRVFKNMRSNLVERGYIQEGDAPSYFIEGLLYNVPNNVFSGAIDETVLAVLTWLSQNQNREQFVCANGFYFLLRDNSSVCWAKDRGAQFVNAAVKLWNDW
jgi:hypothetical protein